MVSGWPGAGWLGKPYGVLPVFAARRREGLVLAA